MTQFYNENTKLIFLSTCGDIEFRISLSRKIFKKGGGGEFYTFSFLDFFWKKNPQYTVPQRNSEEAFIGSENKKSNPTFIQISYIWESLNSGHFLYIVYPLPTKLSLPPKTK